MDAQRLDRKWRARLTTHPIDPRMQFADDGLVLGVGTVLAPAANSARDISIDISQPRLLALLAAAHLREATPLGLAHIRKAVSHWREGDAALASMHLALSGLARLERPVADARRLFLADRFLSEGLEAEFIVSELGHGSSSDGLSKSSADQPRVPAGSGRARGQWTTGATSPSGPPTSSPSPLAPRQRGSGGRHAAPTRTQLVRPQGPRLLSNPLFRPRASRAGAAGQAATDRGLDTRTFRVELPFAIIGAATRPLTAFGQAVKRVADSVEIADSISKWRELGAKGEIAMLAACRGQRVDGHRSTGLCSDGARPSGRGPNGSRTGRNGRKRHRVRRFHRGESQRRPVLTASTGERRLDRRRGRRPSHTDSRIQGWIEDCS